MIVQLVVPGGGLAELEVVGDHAGAGLAQGVDHPGVRFPGDAVAAIAEGGQPGVVEIHDHDLGPWRIVAPDGEAGVDCRQLRLLEQRRPQDVGGEREHDRRPGGREHAEQGGAPLQPRRLEARPPVEQGAREDVVEELVGGRLVDGAQDARA